MIEWNENSPKVSKCTPDKEKAKALLMMVELREKDLGTKSKEFVTLIVEATYEIIKELMTAIMTIDGYKTTSHELLISYLEKFYSFEQSEVVLLDQLRKTRNDIAYRGVMVPEDYLVRNRDAIEKITMKLKLMIEKKLK